MAIDIKQELRAMLETTGQYSVAYPVPDIDPRTVDRLCREALAEIERLEGRVADLQSKYDLACETLARSQALIGHGD